MMDFPLVGNYRYTFALIGFTFFNGHFPDGECNSLTDCVFFTLNFGMVRFAHYLHMFVPPRIQRYALLFYRELGVELEM